MRDHNRGFKLRQLPHHRHDPTLCPPLLFLDAIRCALNGAEHYGELIHGPDLLDAMPSTTDDFGDNI